MSRLVELKRLDENQKLPGIQAEETAPQSQFKEYAERVAKYIPAEVIAFYSGAVQIVLTKEGDGNALFRLWAFAVITLMAWIGTPFYIGMFTDIPKERHVNQIVASIAFGVWAYAYPAGWFMEMRLNEPVIAGLLLITFSFISGFIQPREQRSV